MQLALGSLMEQRAAFCIPFTLKGTVLVHLFRASLARLSASQSSGGVPGGQRTAKPIARTLDALVRANLRKLTSHGRVIQCRVCSHVRTSLCVLGLSASVLVWCGRESASPSSYSSAVVALLDREVQEARECMCPGRRVVRCGLACVGAACAECERFVKNLCDCRQRPWGTGARRLRHWPRQPRAKALADCRRPLSLLRVLRRAARSAARATSRAPTKDDRTSSRALFI